MSRNPTEDMKGLHRYLDIPLHNVYMWRRLMLVRAELIIVY
jgi:hypothetical protein